MDGGCRRVRGGGDLHVEAFDTRRERALLRSMREQHEALDAARSASRARELHPLHAVIEDDRPVDDDEVAAVVVAPRLHAAHLFRAQADLERELLARLIVDEGSQVVGARQLRVPRRHAEAVADGGGDAGRRHRRRAIDAVVGVAGQSQVGDPAVHRFAVDRRPRMIAGCGKQRLDPPFLGDVDVRYQLHRAGALQAGIWSAAAACRSQSIAVVITPEGGTTRTS